MKQRVKPAYIVITHVYQPINTPGPNKGKVNVQEMIEFRDGLKNRHLDSATAILEIREEKVVKDRSEKGTFVSFMTYLDNKYPEEMKKLYDYLGIKKAEDEPVEIVEEPKKAKKATKKSTKKEAVDVAETEVKSPKTKKDKTDVKVSKSASKPAAKSTKRTAKNKID